jgi:O-antigen/teichoic acid export membrane protein
VAVVLIALAAFGHALHAALLYFGAQRRSQCSVVPSEKTSGSLAQLASQYKDFPLYRAPQDFINAASQSLPVLMLAAFFGPAAAGFYTLAKMVMGMPIALVGKAVNDVFYPRITDAAHNGENLLRHIVLATGALLAIGVVPFGLVVLFGPWLFSLVFGGEWAMAGEYARWLALWLLAAFINRPSVATIPVLSLQRGYLLYEIVSVVARVSAILLGVLLFQSDLVAIALFAAVGVVLNLVLIVWILRVACGYKNVERHEQG